MNTAEAIAQTEDAVRSERERAALIQRIDSYLGNGGFFNPEQMDHKMVRTLIIDVRQHLIDWPALDGWIDVKDSLPEHGQEVVASYVGVYRCRIVTFWKDSGGSAHFGVPFEPDNKGSQPATHWMPLPKPPK